MPGRKKVFPVSIRIISLRSVAFWGLVCFSFVWPASAQDGTPGLEKAHSLIASGRLQAALDELQRVVEVQPALADAHYLLSVIYSDSLLRDEKKAAKAIGMALEIEPQNIRYLSARLSQLRSPTPFFIAERIKEAQRVELARRILALDPENALAHEELGVVYIHDFWRYRNALYVPLLQPGLVRNRTTGIQDRSEPEAGTVTQSIAGPNPVIRSNFNTLKDRFDLESLHAAGIETRDLGRRGQEAYQKAIEHLSRAVEKDPTRASAYRQLMRIFALQGDFEPALALLERMKSVDPESPFVYVNLGLANYRLGRMEEADRSFQEAFFRMPAGDVVSFQNIDFLLKPSERQAYRTAPDSFAVGYWKSKDPRFLTPYNERKLEHYARLAYADLIYGIPGTTRRGWETERGQILARYGIPGVEVTLIPGEETGGSTLQSVAEMGPVADVAPSLTAAPNNYRSEIVLQKLQDFDMVAQSNVFNIWDYGDFKFVFEDQLRNGDFRLYSPSATDISAGMDVWKNDYVLLSKKYADQLSERYEFESSGRTLEIPFLAAAFKGDEGIADLYVTFGIPVLTQKQETDLVRVNARSGAFLVSPSHEILSQNIRTIYGLRSQDIHDYEEISIWCDTQALKARPGKQQVSVEFETVSGGTAGVQKREITVPRFQTEHVMLSDLMFAYQVESKTDQSDISNADIDRRGFVITPVPWSVFRRDRPIYLYFEVYNLSKGQEGNTRYEVDITLAPIKNKSFLQRLAGKFAGQDKGVAVRFTGSGTLADEPLYQIFDTAQLEPGRYSMLVHIRDAVAHRTIERRQDLIIE